MFKHLAFSPVRAYLGPSSRLPFFNTFFLLNIYNGVKGEGKFEYVEEGAQVRGARGERDKAAAGSPGLDRQRDRGLSLPGVRCRGAGGAQADTADDSTRRQLRDPAEAEEVGGERLGTAVRFSSILIFVKWLIV